MSRRPWMPLYVSDYLADTAHLNAAESGAYLHLIMHYWQHGRLPSDDAYLARIARLPLQDWQAVKQIMAGFFQEGWTHKRIDKEIGEATNRYEAAKKAGQASAEKRKRTPVERPLNEPSNETANETSTVRVVVSNETTTTLNKEPQKSIDEGSLEVGVTREKKSRGERLPADWTPDLDDIVFARTVLHEAKIAPEIEKFRDYWHARAGPNAVKRDWSATWRNWCRKAAEMGGGGNGQSRSGDGQYAGAGAKSHSALALDFARRAAGDDGS